MQWHWIKYLNPSSQPCRIFNPREEDIATSCLHVDSGWPELSACLSQCIASCTFCKWYNIWFLKSGNSILLWSQQLHLWPLPSSTLFPTQKNIQVASQVFHAFVHSIPHLLFSDWDWSWNSSSDQKGSQVSTDLVGSKRGRREHLTKIGISVHHCSPMFSHNVAYSRHSVLEPPVLEE